MLLNPILVSADVLFSDKSTSRTTSFIENKLEKYSSCHDEKINSSQFETDKVTDCCESPCECGAYGCNATSVTLSANKSQFILSNYSLNYLRDHYLSFISSPSSPPPIV